MRPPGVVVLLVVSILKTSGVGGEIARRDFQSASTGRLSFEYSALASFGAGVSESALLQSAKKSRSAHLSLPGIAAESQRASQTEVRQRRG